MTFPSQKQKKEKTHKISWMSCGIMENNHDSVTPGTNSYDTENVFVATISQLDIWFLSNYLLIRT